MAARSWRTCACCSHTASRCSCTRLQGAPCQRAGIKNGQGAGLKPDSGRGLGSIGAWPNINAGSDCRCGFKPWRRGYRGKWAGLSGRGRGLAFPWRWVEQREGVASSLWAWLIAKGGSVIQISGRGFQPCGRGFASSIRGLLIWGVAKVKRGGASAIVARIGHRGGGLSGVGGAYR